MNMKDIEKEKKEFLEYCKKERDFLVKTYWNYYSKDSDLRVSLENILISFDQLVQRVEKIQNQEVNNLPLTIKQVAAKYGEEVECMFFGYDNEWKKETMTVNATFLKDMEQGAIKNCHYLNT